MKTKFGRSYLTSRQGHGGENPSWIPVANEAVRRMARERDTDFDL